MLTESNVQEAERLLRERNRIVNCWSEFSDAFQTYKNHNPTVVMTLVFAEKCLSVVVDDDALDALTKAQDSEVDRLNTRLEELGVTTVDKELGIS